MCNNRSLPDLVGQSGGCKRTVRWETRTRFAERVTMLRVALLELGFDPYPTPAGLYVLCRMAPAISGRPVIDPWHAAEQLLDGFGVAVMPFAAAPGSLRFSALYETSELDALVELGAGRKLTSG